MTTRYRRHADLRMTALEDEGVVLHLGTRRYFTVSESGRTMLEALEAPCSVEDLVAVLLDEYEVTADDAGASVREFLDRCERAELVHITA